MAYIVKAQYGRYIINDESYLSIFVTAGNTITFDVSDSSNTDHPLKISTTKDGTHGVDENGNQGTELDDATAIVNNGAPGDPNAQIMFTPALDGIFYYYCEHHANMGSSITSVQTKFTDLGATAYDAQDGDITNRITKKIYKKDENNVFQLVESIDDPHGNPWEVLDIDITEQASYKIEYNAKGLDDIDASNQPLERYINIITAPPAFTRPEWMDSDIPIDADGRIWAIQVIYAGRADNTQIEPWTQPAGVTTTLSSGMETFYVPLRNDSIAGAGESEALHSVSNPIAEWDVGIPQTYSFLSHFTSATFTGNPGMRGMLIPPGWEFVIYKYSNYNSQRYSYDTSTFFHQPDDWGSIGDILRNYESVYIDSVSSVSVSRGTNSEGAMPYWMKDGGLYNTNAGGYSYLFRKVAMPT
jgi:plastocyanin